MMFCVSLMSITKDKPRVNTQKIKRKESKNTILQKFIKSQRNRPRQGERNKGTTKQPENN